jgi:thiamine-phosphate pyrophosphorylase
MAGVELKGLYFIFDAGLADEERAFTRLDEVLCCGVDLVQLRAKELSDREFYRWADKTAQLCRLYKKPLIINDRPDIAHCVNADGVHLGQDDMPPDTVKRFFPHKIIGLSANTVEEARAAELAGVHYIGTGALALTATKRDAAAVTHEEFGAIVQAVSIPVFAIGGITPAMTGRIKQLGGCGVAVASALMQSNESRAVISRFKEALTTERRLL